MKGAVRRTTHGATATVTCATTKSSLDTPVIPRFWPKYCEINSFVPNKKNYDYLIAILHELPDGIEQWNKGSKQGADEFVFRDPLWWSSMGRHMHIFLGVPCHQVLGTKHSQEGWVDSGPRVSEVTQCPRADRPCFVHKKWHHRAWVRGHGWGYPCPPLKCKVALD